MHHARGAVLWALVLSALVLVRVAAGEPSHDFPIVARVDTVAAGPHPSVPWPWRSGAWNLLAAGPRGGGDGGTGTEDGASLGSTALHAPRWASEVTPGAHGIVLVSDQSQGMVDPLQPASRVVRINNTRRGHGLFPERTTFTTCVQSASWDIGGVAAVGTSGAFVYAHGTALRVKRACDEGGPGAAGAMLRETERMVTRVQYVEDAHALFWAEVVAWSAETVESRIMRATLHAGGGGDAWLLTHEAVVTPRVVSATRGVRVLDAYFAVDAACVRMVFVNDNDLWSVDLATGTASKLPTPPTHSNDAFHAVSFGGEQRVLPDKQHDTWAAVMGSNDVPTAAEPQVDTIALSSNAFADVWSTEFSQSTFFDLAEAHCNQTDANGVPLNGVLMTGLKDPHLLAGNRTTMASASVDASCYQNYVHGHDDEVEYGGYSVAFAASMARAAVDVAAQRVHWTAVTSIGSTLGLSQSLDIGGGDALAPTTQHTHTLCMSGDTGCHVSDVVVHDGATYTLASEYGAAPFGVVRNSTSTVVEGSGRGWGEAPVVYDVTSGGVVTLEVLAWDGHAQAGMAAPQKRSLVSYDMQTGARTVLGMFPALSSHPLAFAVSGNFLFTFVPKGLAICEYPTCTTPTIIIPLGASPTAATLAVDAAAEHAGVYGVWSSASDDEAVVTYWDVTFGDKPPLELGTLPHVDVVSAAVHSGTLVMVTTTGSVHTLAVAQGTTSLPAAPLAGGRPVAMTSHCRAPRDCTLYVVGAQEDAVFVIEDSPSIARVDWTAARVLSYRGPVRDVLWHEGHLWVLTATRLYRDGVEQGPVAQLSHDLQYVAIPPGQGSHAILADSKGALFSLNLDSGTGFACNIGAQHMGLTSMVFVPDIDSKEMSQRFVFSSADHMSVVSCPVSPGSSYCCTDAPIAVIGTDTEISAMAPTYTTSGPSAATLYDGNVIYVVPSVQGRVNVQVFSAYTGSGLGVSGMGRSVIASAGDLAHMYAYVEADEDVGDSVACSPRSLTPCVLGDGVVMLSMGESDAATHPLNETHVSAYPAGVDASHDACTLAAGEGVVAFGTADRVWMRGADSEPEALWVSTTNAVSVDALTVLSADAVGVFVSDSDENTATLWSVATSAGHAVTKVVEVPCNVADGDAPIAAANAGADSWYWIDMFGEVSLLSARNGTTRTVWAPHETEGSGLGVAVVPRAPLSLLVWALALDSKHMQLFACSIDTSAGSDGMCVGDVQSLAPQTAVTRFAPLGPTVSGTALLWVFDGVVFRLPSGAPLDLAYVERAPMVGQSTDVPVALAGRGDDASHILVVGGTDAAVVDVAVPFGFGMRTVMPRWTPASVAYVEGKGWVFGRREAGTPQMFAAGHHGDVAAGMPTSLPTAANAAQVSRGAFAHTYVFADTVRSAVFESAYSVSVPLLQSAGDRPHGLSMRPGATSDTPWDFVWVDQRPDGRVLRTLVAAAGERAMLWDVRAVRVGRVWDAVASPVDTTVYLAADGGLCAMRADTPCAWVRPVDGVAWTAVALSRNATTLFALAVPAAGGADDATLYTLALPLSHGSAAVALTAHVHPFVLDVVSAADAERLLRPPPIVQDGRLTGTWTSGAVEASFTAGGSATVRRGADTAHWPAHWPHEMRAAFSTATDAVPQRVRIGTLQGVYQVLQESPAHLTLLLCLNGPGEAAPHTLAPGGCTLYTECSRAVPYPSPSATPPPPGHHHATGLNTGAIVGGVMGALAVLFVALGLFERRRRHDRLAQSHSAVLLSTTA